MVAKQAAAKRAEMETGARRHAGVSPVASGEERNPGPVE